MTTSIYRFVYMEDTDCTGVVYHSNYLRWWQQGREAVLGQQGLVDLFASSGRSFVVCSVEQTFKKSARLGQAIEIRTIPTVESKYRLSFDCGMYREGEKDPLVYGKVEMVCVGRDMKLVALPEEIVNDVRAIDVVVPPKPKPRLPPPRRRPASAVPLASGLPHVHPIEVYHEDTDFTGVVYYAQYYKFCERARSHMCGMGHWMTLVQSGVCPVVVAGKITVKDGANYGDLLEIRSVPKIESTHRIIFEQTVVRVGRQIAADGAVVVPTVLVVAQITLVFVKLDNGGATKNLVALPPPLLDEFRNRYGMDIP
eukprot:CAMPEP_0204263528 /NCGR_PEP_ID=MMETSP0468-20130131/8411_1 /ASSEMBLY_ACC=CAM_ASM_000383 /TAXON_ID=2969 /ORGANISM="Oxyrrhis marina" /LENGTH=310 /DNA_ID=CAMNT_0051238305 /DNA_START=28 /DNA_END=960 /DNA_ORIENTATION=+